MPRGRRFEEPKLNLKKVFAVAIAFVVLIMVIIMPQMLKKLLRYILIQMVEMQ